MRAAWALLNSMTNQPREGAAIAALLLSVVYPFHCVPSMGRRGDRRVGQRARARAITHAARCAACLAPSPTKGLAQLGRPEQNELLHFSQPRGSMRVGERLNEKLVGR